MAGPGPQPTSPPAPGGEEVRVTRGPRLSRRAAILYLLGALLAVAAALAYLLGARDAGGDVRATATAPQGATVAGAAETEAVAPRPPEMRRIARARRIEPPTAAPPEEPFEMPSTDPDDIAAYIRPGDPEPTGAELIEALHHAGVRTGIGAFNPPGTSPLLVGLEVPEDYVLPEGFVRHYQVTDEGEPLPAILLFSPDYQFFDAEGRPVPIPENRVVPPELAPPDLPLRPSDPPSP